MLQESLVPDTNKQQKKKKRGGVCTASANQVALSEAPSKTVPFQIQTAPDVELEVFPANVLTHFKV